MVVCILVTNTGAKFSIPPNYLEPFPIIGLHFESIFGKKKNLTWMYFCSGTFYGDIWLYDIYPLNLFVCLLEKKMWIYNSFYTLPKLVSFNIDFFSPLNAQNFLISDDWHNQILLDWHFGPKNQRQIFWSGRTTLQNSKHVFSPLSTSMILESRMLLRSGGFFKYGDKIHTKQENIWYSKKLVYKMSI